MVTDFKARAAIFFGIIIVAVVFLLPTVLKDKMPESWISQPISLGLDLSGGAHLLYEVQTEEAVKNRLQSVINNIRTELRSQKVAVTRAKALDNHQIELVLLSELFLDKAKATIANSFRELTFVESSTEEAKVRLVYGITEAQAKQIKADAVSHAIELLRNRVDKFGVTEPLIQKVGTERILLQMPGVSDIDAVKKVVGSVGKLEFRLVARGAAADGQVSFKTREGGTTMLEEDVAMGGDAVEKAAVGFGDRGVHVELTLNSDGAKTFRKVTSENVGRQLAIILDGVVFSAPEIQTAIPDGHAQITGRFTPEEARQLAVVLREALPAPLKALEERTVGPTLGMESIKSGVLAILVGFAAIIIFMIAYYKKSGVVAIISLAINMVLMVAALSAFGATLTLPGIAGLALTIGMAVDANVIIFERIKEEIQNGSTRDAAVAAGFDKALSAILDSNITTLLAAAILYYFGTGSIRGFAVTLSIGIATTVYAATFGSRFLFDALPLRGSKGLSI